MQKYFEPFLWGWIVLAVIAFVLQLKIAAPYGRYSTAHKGRSVPNRVGWLLMELPAVLVFAWFFFSSGTERSVLNWLFFAAWQIHYLHRSLIFPLRLASHTKPMPLYIMLSAMGFNCINGFFNGYNLGVLQPQYALEWLFDIRNIAGMVLFVCGVTINWWADAILLRLRATGTYQIPETGLFRLISCPNYFGELLEWIGFALMTWSLPALSFALWTAANLIPRAIKHHQWYRQHFRDYPDSRRAILPYLL
ncbi:DUF1295 domain-containing protein [candidate division KSB1 bacterium]|nr:DUF1295 domain-containing protein [candidate division KSB1 bacterium]